MRRAYLCELTMQLVVSDAVRDQREELSIGVCPMLSIYREEKNAPYVHERLCEPIRKIGRNFLTYRTETYCHIHRNYTEVLFSM